MSNTVELKVTLNLKPFLTPNFVTVESVKGDKPSNWSDETNVPLSALDGYTLERMCDEFRAEIFKKAGKCRPPQGV